MEFGKHLGKGLWALADKALPVAYGIAYVVLVIRVLPEEEFGNFVLVQEIFLIISGLATAFALQPLLKFGAEDRNDQPQVVGAALLLNAAFVIVSSLLLFVLSGPLGALFNSAGLAALILWVPAMLVASFVRNFALILLQTKFFVQRVFWTDAAHFLGAPVLIWIWSRLHMFNSALDMVIINVISLSVSSVVSLFLSSSMLRISLRPGKDLLLQMWNYGKYSFGGIVSYLFYSKSDSFILSAVSGPVQVAVYNSAKIFIRIFEMVTQVIQMFIVPATSKLSSRADFDSLRTLIEKSLLFSTIGMIPVFAAFLFLPSIFVHILYGGRYMEAVPILQVFSLLSFVIALMTIGTSALLGLGEAKAGFILGMQMLLISMLSYGVFIPLFGGVGAAVGCVVASFATTWLTMVKLKRFIPFTVRSALSRTDDIRIFIASKWPGR